MSNSNYSFSFSEKILSTPYFIISVFFLLTIFIRFSAFNGPIQGSHAWLTAHTAITLELWDKHGVADSKFSPIYTYENSTNRNMRSLASGLPDQDGNYYYVSYPPFSFFLGYFLTKVLFLPININSLQIINIALHYITAILLYILTCILYRKDSSKLFLPALIASCIYIFSAQSLWCHTYMYFADTLIQPIWTAQILLAFYILRRRNYSDKKLVIIFFIINFLSVYTEWLGFFTSLTILTLSLVFNLTAKKAYYVTLVIVMSTCLALGLTLAQYSAINGLEEFISASIEKYTSRSGHQYDDFYFTKIEILILLRHYWRLHFPILIFIIFMSFSSVIIYRNLKSGSLKDHLFILLLLLLPILIHHSAFIEFSSMHDFSTLKTLIAFSLIAAFIFNLNLRLTNSYQQKKLFLYTSLPILIVLLALNILLFLRQLNDSPETIFSLLSKQIGSSTNQNEAVYAISKYDRDNGVIIFMGTDRAFSPQIQFLTKRNILAVADRQTAISHMRSSGNSHARIFILDVYGQIIGIDTLKI